jgi:hypothetical protein
MTTLQRDPLAMTVQCPACQAKPGEPCHVPTDNGRRNVGWYHLARVEQAHYGDQN